MGSSKVTDYFISYMEEKGISAAWAAEITGIPQEKIMAGYTEPLHSDEFLLLCVRLFVSPETVASAIRDS